MSVAVPTEIALTTPVALTVATKISDDIHGLTTAGVEALVKVVVDPSQTVNVPEITGMAITVTVAVIIQLLLLI